MKKKLFLFVLIIASVQIYADTRAQALSWLAMQILTL